MYTRQGMTAEARAWTADIPPLDRMIPAGLKAATFAMG